MTRPRHLRVVRDARDTAIRDHARRHDLFKRATGATYAAALELHGDEHDAAIRIHDAPAKLLGAALERNRP